MYIIQFLLMTPPMLAVCWLTFAGAGRFGALAFLVRVASIVTFALWCVFPLEQFISGKHYSSYLVAMALFQSGIVIVGILAFFSKPAWPQWAIWLVRIIGAFLALMWGFNLVFMMGVLFA